MNDTSNDISDDDIGEILARARLDAPVPLRWDQVLERHDEVVRRRAGRRRGWTMAVAAAVVAIGCLGLVVALQARSDDGGDDPAAVDQPPGSLVGPGSSPDPLADLSEGDWVVPTVLPAGYEVIAAITLRLGGLNGAELLVGGDDVAEVLIHTRAVRDRNDNETASTPATGPTDVDAGEGTTVEVNGIHWEIQSLEGSDGVTLVHILERDVNDRVVSLSTSGPLDVLIEMAGGLGTVPDAELDVPRLDADGGDYTTVATLGDTQLLAHGVNGVYCLELQTADGASSRSCWSRTEPDSPVVTAIGSGGPAGSFTAGLAEADVARIEFTTVTGDTVVVEPTDMSGSFDNRFWITDQPGVGPASVPDHVVVTYDDGTSATLDTTGGLGWTLTDQPSTGAAVTPTTDPAVEWAGVEWESSGIPRTCAVETADLTAGCTQIVHDPSGVPISYDVNTRTLTRHVREDGEFVRAVLPESSGDHVWLVAAGPGEVVYLNVTDQPGAEGSADLVAVALAPGEAGRELERAVGRGNPGSDSDFAVTPHGLVTTDWYGQGPRPAADRTPVMSWVDRGPQNPDSPEPGVDAHSNRVDSITIDAYEATVTVNGRTWQITGQAAELPPTGMPPIVGTFDGGFIARYDEVVDEYRTIVVRGWPDGSVDEWVVPGGGPDGLGWTVVPEPMGTVLVAHGDTFARATPFGAPPSAWDARLEVDVERGVVDVAALNDHLATLDWTVSQPPWDIDPVAFANAAAAPLSSPAELRTITHVDQDGGTAIVTVTDERFLDDSVYATRLTLTIADDLRSVESIAWANSCQPRRGHQTFEAAYCT